MDIFGSLWLVEGTLAIGYQGCIISSTKLLCAMSNVGGWWGAFRVKYKKMTIPECWLPVEWEQMLDCLSANRSPHLYTGHYGW